jgi:hypothetical protein
LGLVSKFGRVKQLTFVLFAQVVSQDEIEINAQFETKDEDGNPKGPFWIPDCDTKEHSSWQLAFKFLCTVRPSFGVLF